MNRLASGRALAALRPAIGWRIQASCSPNQVRLLLPTAGASCSLVARRGFASAAGPTVAAQSDVSSGLRPTDARGSSASEENETLPTDIPDLVTSTPFSGEPAGNGFDGAAATVESADAVSAAIESASEGDTVVEAAVETATWSDTLLTPVVSFISSVHDATGLPWWLTIGAATLTVRTMMLPMSVYTMRNASKMAAVQDDLKSMRDDIMTAMKSGNRELALKKQEAQKEFMRAAGISPGRVLLGPLVQLPVFISFFVGIRRMAENNPEFATGGVAWFMDLSAKDPMYGLPILAGISLFAMTELGGETGTKMTPVMRQMMRFMAVGSVPMTGWMPAAVFCYWIPNNIFSACLSGALKSPTLKRNLGLTVDPATITGTKAATKAARHGDLTGAVSRPLSATEAASSYMKSNVKEVNSQVVAAVTSATKPPKLRRGKPKVRIAKS